MKKRFVPGIGIMVILCFRMFGIAQVKNLPVPLSQGEEVLQVAAQRDQYAALTVHGKSDPKFKRYYILMGTERKGPYDEVIDLQAAFDTVGFIYAARNDTNWYVYDGNRKYGPYSTVSKVRSGDQKHRCLYLARWKTRYNQVLYDRAEVIGGSYVVSECPDYELSANGTSYSLFYGGFLADYFMDKDHEILGNCRKIEKMRLSDDGRDVGFMYERSIMDIMSSHDTKNKYFSGIIRYMYPGSFGEYKIIDTLENFMKAGDIAFYRKNNYPGYYCSFQNSQGIWKLLRNGADMKVTEREILLIQPLANDNVAYAAKPGEPGPKGLDTAQYYIYISQQPAGGPYLEVRQILPSPGGTSMAVEARTKDGWYLIIPGGGIGPFGEIQDAAVMGEGILGFKAVYQGEWTSILVTSAGMGAGSLIKEKGQAIGIANYSQGNVQILVQ